MLIIKNHTDAKTGIKTVPIRVRSAHQWVSKDDQVAIEEPLEICVVTGDDGIRLTHNIAITMRTPGHDRELALGFLLSEGILTDMAPVADVAFARDDHGEALCNRIEVTLKPGTPFDVAQFSRHVFTSSSCGICGKITIDHIRSQGLAPPQPSPRPAANILMSLPDKLRQHQALFQATGGLHAAALFNQHGQLQAVREDVGRHNAVDKLVGAMLQSGLFPGHDHLLMLSGRASFELLQKAIAAGLPHVAAIGAPSSLAIDLANEFGVNLIGFLRNQQFNFYTHGSPT